MSDRILCAFAFIGVITVFVAVMNMIGVIDLHVRNGESGMCQTSHPDTKGNK